jgi:hypothetical protein
MVRLAAFTANDTAANAPAVMLNEAAVRRYFGKPIRSAVRWNSRYETARAAPRSLEPWQASWETSSCRAPVKAVGGLALGADPLRIAIQTADDPINLARAAGEQLRRMDRDMPFFQASPLSAAVESSFL